MCPHRDVHKFIWTFRDGKTRNQIDHILTDRRQYSRVFDVRSSKGANCDTGRCLMVAIVRETLAVSTSKQITYKFHMEKFNQETKRGRG
jgi:hypothetical protein